MGLALFVRSELTLSDRDYEKLRLAFCKRYVTAVDRWQKRVWYKCPITGRTLNMPEPLVSKYKWMPAWKHALSELGLALSSDGTVAERSFLRASRTMIDLDRDQLLDPTTVTGQSMTNISQ